MVYRCGTGDVNGATGRGRAPASAHSDTPPPAPQPRLAGRWSRGWLASYGVVTAAHDPVGPIPPGADPGTYDRVRRRVLWRMPSGLYLLGSRSGDERNLMTLNWATQVSTDPKLVAVGVEKSALTHRLVEAGGCFTLCVLARSDRAVVRAFVKPATWDGAGSTLNGHPVREGATGAPIFAGAAAWLDCQVRHHLDLGSHSLFVGEVVDAGEAARDEAGDDAGEPEVLRMEDTRMSYGG